LLRLCPELGEVTANLTPNLKSGVVPDLLDQNLLAMVNVLGSIYRQSNGRRFFGHKLPQSIRLKFCVESRHNLRIGMIEDELAHISGEIERQPLSSTPA